MIYVFKTSVSNKMQAEQLRPHLDTLFPNEKWNFDLEDCDRILRIDSDENVVSRIRELLSSYKIHCEELE